VAALDPGRYRTLARIARGEKGARMKVSMFENAFQKAPKDAALDAILNAIKNGRWRKRIDPIRATYAKVLARTGDGKKAKAAIEGPKKKLPAFCISGTAEHRKKMREHSGLLQIDCDGLNNTLETIREKVKGDPYVAFGFISPSGDGLKLGCRIDGTRHAESFGAARAYFRQRYGLEIDESVKDPLRLCFVSYDPETWTRESAEQLPLPAVSVVSDSGSLELTNLENVIRLPGGSTRAACPACRAAGGDHSGEHLLVDPAGRFGCAKYPGDGQHRKEIWRLTGKPIAQVEPGNASADIRGFIVRTLLSKDAPFQQRRKISDAVVSALSEAGRLFHHAELRDFDSAMFFDSQRKRLERIRSDSFLSWLSEWLAVNRADNLFRHIQAAVETAALSTTAARAILPAAYWHATPDAIYLSNGDGRLVRLTARGLEPCDNGSDGVLFAAGQTLKLWNVEAMPTDPFDTCRLFRDARAAARHGKDILRAWVYSLPTNPRCKPPLCLAGEIGSGKTRLAAGVAELYGVPFNAQKVEESSEADFWPTLDAGGVACFDNADSRTRWLADALACAATGGSQRRRRLYTNAELVTLRANAWLVVTTANPTFASDAGLADRLLLVRTHRADGDTSDAELSDEITANRDAGLVHLAETIAAALKDSQPTPSGLNQRHPDFAAFAVKLGRALNREAETIAALQSAEVDKSAFCLENDNIASALVAYLGSAGTFTGTAAELAPHLVEMDGDLKDRLGAKRLGRRLTALWPHLHKALAVAKKEPDRTGLLHFTLAARADCADF
jgi:VirE N-terminal domain